MFSESLFRVAGIAKRWEGKPTTPVFSELINWIHANYKVKVIAVRLHGINSHQPIPFLDIVLDSDEDRSSWMKNAATICPTIKDRIIRKYNSLAGEIPALYDSDMIRLAIYSYCDACLERAHTEFYKYDAGEIITEFPDIQIWKISGFFRSIVVFVETNEDYEHFSNGTYFQKIYQRCYEAVQQYDEFGYLSEATFRLKFDTKENLDEHFEGSLFYYFK